MYGGDDGARTRDLCRDSEKERRNLQKTSVTDGFFWRSKVPLATVIGPLSDPRPLPCKPLPKQELSRRIICWKSTVEPRSLVHKATLRPREMLTSSLGTASGTLGLSWTVRRLLLLCQLRPYE